MFRNIHNFVLKLYSTNVDITSVNVLRGIMATSTTITKLPPTEDSLRQHCLRSYYQTKVWVNSLQPRPQLPNVTDFGWNIDVEGNITPILSTKKGIFLIYLKFNIS